MAETPYSIGTEKESGLHRALKFRYAGEGETERSLEGYICDGINEEGEIIEVQTGSFGPLKEKIKAFSARGKIRIIHPIAVVKFIELLDKTGKTIRKRKSPRQGTEWDLFDHLLYAPELPLVPGLIIELVLVDVLEQRIDDGKGSWRRKGARILGRELTAWRGALPLERPADYLRFVPFGKDEEFTRKDLAEKTGISPVQAGKTLYVLAKMGLITRTGKKGRSFLYSIRTQKKGRP
jgi:DNA-binding transcriptional ArsR family regulator